tara:strand:- start:235 stop:408 length:174 start_codon:yes stop_codon:yes gene_type:complete
MAGIKLLLILGLTWVQTNKISIIQAIGYRFLFLALLMNHTNSVENIDGRSIFATIHV